MTAARKPRELLELQAPLKTMKEAYKQMESERYFSENRTQKASKLESLLTALSEKAFIDEIEKLLKDKNVNYDEWIKSVGQFLFVDSGISEVAKAMLPTVGIIGRLLTAFGQRFIKQENVEAAKTLVARKLIGEGTLFSILKILSVCVETKQEKLKWEDGIKKITEIKNQLVTDSSCQADEVKAANDKTEATQESWLSWFTKSKTFLDDLSKFADSAIEFVESFKPEVEQKQEPVVPIASPSSQSSAEEVLKRLRAEHEALEKKYQALELAKNEQAKELVLAQQKFAQQAEESKKINSLNNQLNDQGKKLLLKTDDILQQNTQLAEQVAKEQLEFKKQTEFLQNEKDRIEDLVAKERLEFKQKREELEAAVKTEKEQVATKLDEQKVQLEAKFAEQIKAFQTMTAQLAEAQAVNTSYAEEIARINSQEGLAASAYRKQAKHWGFIGIPTATLIGTGMICLPNVAMNISFGGAVLMTMPLLNVVVGVAVLVIGISYCMYRARKSYQLANKMDASVTSRCALFPKLTQHQQKSAERVEDIGAVQRVSV